MIMSRLTLLTRGALLAAVLITVQAAPDFAHAAFLTDWSTGATMVTADNPYKFPSPEQDITAAWHKQSGGYHYFRLDLAQAPDPNPANGNFAGLYGIYIDSVVGGPAGSSIAYVPDELNGIDHIVDSHYDPNMGSFFQSDFHTWNGSFYQRSLPVAYQQSENNGRTIEWQVTTQSVGQSFTWWAATHDNGSVVQPYAYDITAPVSSSPVPVPAAIWLMGSGLLAMTGIRRRK
jgi:hypothetical protein